MGRRLQVRRARQLFLVHAVVSKTVLVVQVMQVPGFTEQVIQTMVLVLFRRLRALQLNMRKGVMEVLEALKVQQFLPQVLVVLVVRVITVE